VNCTSSHSASDQRCPFWCHHFDRSLLSTRIALVNVTTLAFEATLGGKHAWRHAGWPAPQQQCA
jgi:hypothetical protein